MARKSIFCLLLIGSALYIQALDYSLFGTVKDANRKPIANAVVHTYLLDSITAQCNALANHYKQNSPRAVTDSQGVFHLSGQLVDVLQSEVSPVPQLQFMIKNSAIAFSPPLHSVSGRIAVFSADGKQITSILFKDIKGGRSIALPSLSVGLTILRLSIGKESSTRTLFNLDNTIYFGNVSSNIHLYGNLKMAQQTAMADTLVAAKKEFITKQVPINSNTQQNIDVTLDSGVCRRLFQISDSIIPNWKMGDSTLDKSFSIWSSMDLYIDIDGGYDRYTQRGMLQAADLWMTGQHDSTDTTSVHSLLRHSFIMDFGDEVKATAMYQYSENIYYKQTAKALPGYDTSDAFAANSVGGYTLYAHYKQFYFELIIDGYSNKEQALSDAKVFFEFFKGKIK